MTTQFFSPDHMAQIAEFYSGLHVLMKQCGFNPIGPSTSDLFVNEVSIILRHGDGWDFGRFELDEGLLVFNMDVPENTE